MTLRTHWRLSLTGFLLIYFGAVGSLVVVAMPVLSAYKPALIAYTTLPALVIGIAVIVFEKIKAPDRAPSQ